MLCGQNAELLIVKGCTQLPLSCKELGNSVYIPISPTLPPVATCVCSLSTTYFHNSGKFQGCMEYFQENQQTSMQLLMTNN
jgi:hypothetical protein